MSPRNVSTRLFLVVCLGAGAACIKRTAAPPTEAAAAAASKPSAAVEAANARLAGVARVDLLAGAGIKAFGVKGETAKVDVTTVPVSGQPFTEAARFTIKEASSHEYAVQTTAPIASAIEEG